MKILILFDSLYGNTAKIAEAMAGALNAHGEVTLMKVGEALPGQLSEMDLIVAGSPTQQFRPTAGMKKFLAALPKNALRGIKVAAFDTRLTDTEIDKTPPLPIFVKMFGFAAGRIAKTLREKGGELVSLPEGFYVRGMEGPLVEGELERAATWTETLFA